MKIKDIMQLMSKLGGGGGEEGVGGKRLVLQFYRNGCIKIFKTNCNIGSNV